MAEERLTRAQNKSYCSLRAMIYWTKVEIRINSQSLSSLPPNRQLRNMSHSQNDLNLTVVPQLAGAEEDDPIRRQPVVPGPPEPEDDECDCCDSCMGCLEICMDILTCIYDE